MGQGKHKAKRGKLVYLSIPSGGASSGISVSRVSEPEDEWVFRVDDVTSGGAAFVAGIRIGDVISTFQWATSEKKPWDDDTLEALENPDSESDGFAIVSICKKYPLEDVEKEFQKSRDAAIQKKQSTWKSKEKLNQLPQFVRDSDMKHPYLSDTVTEPALGKRRTTNRGTNEEPRLKKPRHALNGNMSDSEISERDSCASSLGPSEGEEENDEEEGDGQLLQQEGDDGEEKEDEEESNVDSNAPEADAVLRPHHLARSPAPSNTLTDESAAEVPPPPVAAPTAEALLLQAIKEATDNSGKISSSSKWISRLFDLLGVSTGNFLEQSDRPAPADFVGLLEQTVKTLAEWSSLAGQDDGDMAASINRVVDAAALLPSKAGAEVNVEPTTEQIGMLEVDVESTSDPDRAKLRRIKAEQKDMEVCMKITGLLSAQRERVDRLDEMITERQDCRHTVVVPAIPGGSEVAREACTRANAKVAKLAEEFERAAMEPSHAWLCASNSVLGAMDGQARGLVHKFTFEQQVSTLKRKAAELREEDKQVSVRALEALLSESVEVFHALWKKHGDRLGNALLEYFISAAGRMDKMKKDLAGHEVASGHYEDSYPSDQEERMRSRCEEVQGLIDTVRTEMGEVINSQANLWKLGTDRVERLLCGAKEQSRLLNSKIREEILMGEGVVLNG